MTIAVDTLPPFSNMRARCARCAVTPLIVAVLTLGLAQEARPQFSETQFNASDGTRYQVLRAVPPLSSGAEGTRVTTVAGSSIGVGGCNLSQSMAGGIAAAIAGVLPPGQSLHPYNQVSRTGILTPDDIDIDHFFASFGGRVQLGTSNADCTGAGAPNACCTGVGTGTCSPLNVCHTAFDCMGQPNVQTLVPLSSATGGIPGACIANGVSAGTQCDGTNVRNVFAFGLPATGNVCDNPLNVTADTTICAPAPADGFTLMPGQAVVFVYNTSLLGLGFSTGAAGFGIDTDGMNSPGCMPNQVVGADTRLDSPPPVPTPSPTPSGTPTETPTLTPAPALAGAVRYYAQDRPVPGVDVRLLGGGVPTSTTTDATGDFAFSTVSSVPHLLEPAKQGDVNAAVTALDAAFVLQKVAGLRTFSGDQSLACDVTGDGTVSALDASRILQFQAELIDHSAVADLCGSDWLFRPMPGPAENQILVQPQIGGGTCQQGAIGYDPLVPPVSAQDFVAILFGDCTGNWNP